MGVELALRSQTEVGLPLRATIDHNQGVSVIDAMHGRLPSIVDAGRCRFSGGVSLEGQRINNASVLGAGTIGSSWATLFALHGVRTRLYDIDPSARAGARKRIGDNLEFMVSSGLITRGTAERALSMVTVCNRLEDAASGTQYVQEAIAENYDAKCSLFRQVEDLCDRKTVLASSSSGLLISKIQDALASPDRCLIASPWNPPHLVPLVEIVAGRYGSSEAVEITKAFLKRLGREPVVLRKEVPGHIGNRLAAALWREAIDLVHQGVASVEDVDTVVRAGLGIRWAIMGPNFYITLGAARRVLNTSLTTWVPLSRPGWSRSRPGLGFRRTQRLNSWLELEKW